MFFYIFPRASICLEITETARRTAILVEAMEPETTTGPGQLAMSGPVIRFALVVTSLLGKLAISSWPPPPSSPLVVSNRFPSWRFAVATKPLSTGHRTCFACTWGEKRCDRNVARDDQPYFYSAKLYRRFVIFADVTIARSKTQQLSWEICNDIFLLSGFKRGLDRINYYPIIFYWHL